MEKKGIFYNNLLYMRIIIFFPIFPLPTNKRFMDKSDPFQINRTNFLKRKQGDNVIKDLPSIDISDDKVQAVLEYFDSSVTQSHITTNYKHQDVSYIINLYNDRINDITVLSSICKGLINSNSNLKKRVCELEKLVRLHNEKDIEINNYLHLSNTKNEFYDPIEISGSCPNSPEKKENLGELSYYEDNSCIEEACDSIKSQNQELILKLMTLTKARSIADNKESTLVNEIVEQLIETQTENSSLTSRLAEQINEYLQQQSDLSELIICCTELQKKYDYVVSANNKLKRKVKILTDSNKIKRAQIEKMGINVKELEDNLNHNYRQQQKENRPQDSILLPLDSLSFSPHLETSTNAGSIKSEDKNFQDNDLHVSRSSLSIAPSSDYESNPNLLTRKFIDENGVERIQIIKTIQGSKLMEKWRNLNNNSELDGFNSLANFQKTNDVQKTPHSNNLLKSSFEPNEPEVCGEDGLAQLVGTPTPTGFKPKIVSCHKNRQVFKNIKARWLTNSSDYNQKINQDVNMVENNQTNCEDDKKEQNSPISPNPNHNSLNRLKKQVTLDKDVHMPSSAATPMYNIFKMLFF